MENKFAAISVTVPLTETMQKAYGPIKVVTEQLKNTMGLIYGVYAISFWSALFLPRLVSNMTVLGVSKKYTIGFSNTAGPIKPFSYECPETGKIIENVSSQTYIITAGNLGWILGAVS